MLKFDTHHFALKSIDVQPGPSSSIQSAFRIVPRWWHFTRDAINIYFATVKSLYLSRNGTCASSTNERPSLNLQTALKEIPRCDQFTPQEHTRELRVKRREIRRPTASTAESIEAVRERNDRQWREILTQDGFATLQWRCNSAIFLRILPRVLLWALLSQYFFPV